MLSALRAKFLGRDECRVIVVGLNTGTAQLVSESLKTARLLRAVNLLVGSDQRPS